MIDTCISLLSNSCTTIPFNPRLNVLRSTSITISIQDFKSTLDLNLNLQRMFSQQRNSLKHFYVTTKLLLKMSNRHRIHKRIITIQNTNESNSLLEIKFDYYLSTFVLND